MSLFSISFLAGILLGLTFLPRLADLAGRKTVYYLGLVIHVILVSTSFLVKDDSIFYGVVFLMGLEQVARFTVGYVYLSEFCCNHIQRPLVTTLAMFVSAESAMICAIYFRYISKKWQYFELVGLGMALIALSSVCFIPESPRWLISRGRYKKAFEVYKRVAKFNGVLFTDMIWRLTRDQAAEKVNKGLLADPNQYLEINKEEIFIEESVADIPFDQRIDKPRIFRDLIWGPKKRVLGVKFLALLVIWCTYLYSYQVVEAFLQYTLSDIYTDMIVLANAEAFGYVLAGLLYIRNGDRARGIIMVSMLATALLTSISLAVNNVVDTNNKNVIVNLLIMAIRFTLSVSFNALLMETFAAFPTIYLCTVIGVLNFLGRLCGMIGPSHDQSHFNGAKIGMIVTTFVSALVAFRFLKQ